MVPLTFRPNAPNQDGYTPIHRAAWKGHTEIVQILAPLTDNPNAPNKAGETPIDYAFRKGYTEIVKILKSFKTSKEDIHGASKKPCKNEG